MNACRTASLVLLALVPSLQSYCGLGIVTRSPSDWVREGGGQWVRAEVRQTRGLTRKRQQVLKAIFKGAATTMIGQLVDDPLHADYQRMLRTGIKPNLAKLTLARRIAAIVLSMWKHEEVYDPKRHRASGDKSWALRSARQARSDGSSALRNDNGSMESIHTSVGSLDAAGRSLLEAERSAGCTAQFSQEAARGGAGVVLVASPASVRGGACGAAAVRPAAWPWRVRDVKGRKGPGAFLALWVKRQRRLKKVGRLPPDRIRLLELLPGWAWEPGRDGFEKGLAALQRFARREGHAVVARLHVERGFPLGMWVNRQRRRFVRGLIPADEKRRLEAVKGWRWRVVRRATRRAGRRA